MSFEKKEESTDQKPVQTIVWQSPAKEVIALVRKQLKEDLGNPSATNSMQNYKMHWKALAAW